MLHFKNHQNNCACNKNLYNVRVSENWKDLEHGGCERCKKTEQYQQARQLWREENELSNCGLNIEEFFKSINKNASNVEFLNLDKEWESTQFTKPDLDFLFHREEYNIQNRHGYTKYKKLKLENYRIKSIPSIEQQQKDGWNGKTIKKAELHHDSYPDCGTLDFSQHAKGLHKDEPKPIEYMFSEDQMIDIANLINKGISPRVTYDENPRIMKDQAFEIHINCFLKLKQLINTVRGV